MAIVRHDATGGRTQDADAPLTILRRAWAAPLWAHAAVLAILLLALLPVMLPQSAFTEDEGAYALQVRSLENGSWAYQYKAAPFDPDGRWFPVKGSSENDGRFYTYIQHPAYPLLMRAAAAMVGTTLGLHLIAMLGAVGAAAAAWLLAGEIEHVLRRPAFWVVAGSPVLVNGMLPWAHAPSAALAGFAVVAAAQISRRGLTPGNTLGVVAALVGGVLLRSEGVVFAGALATAVAAMRFRRGGFWSALVSFGVLAGAGAVAVVAERAWVRSIAGGAFDNLGARESTADATAYLRGRLDGAFHSLFQAHDEVSAASLPVLAVLGLVAGLGYVALRRWRPTSRRDVVLMVAGAVLLYGLRLATHPTEAVTGLFSAWPLAALGLLLVSWRQRQPTVDLCLLVLGTFGAGVLATQYQEGGGLEWGGRFFSPATVPLAVVATAAIAHRLRSAPVGARRSTTVAVAGLAVASALFSIATVGAARAAQDRLIAVALRHPATVTVTTVAVYPRLAWRTHDRLSWMLTDDEGLPELLRTLRAEGVVDVALVTGEGVPPASLAAYDDVRRVVEPALAEVGASMILLRARE